MLLTARQAAALLAREFRLPCTPERLADLARRGHGPSYRRFDTRRLYEPDAVREWAASCLSGPIATRDTPYVSAGTRAQIN